MDMSEAIKEAYEHAPSNVTYFDCLVISHQDFTESVKLVRSNAPLVTAQGTFQPCWFDFALPATEGNVRGEMTVTVNFIPKDVQIAVRDACKTRYSASIKYYQYLGPAPATGAWNPDAELPIPLQVASVDQTPTGIAFSALFPDLQSSYFPRRVMTTTVLPGGNV